MLIAYEDNHIIIVSKRSGEIVQGDKTGDTPLAETVKVYLKEAYAKPGNVFFGSCSSVRPTRLGIGRLRKDL